MAGFATEARRQLLQALGFKWLDAGMGCGVGLGYGYGGGIVLKPSAAEELATTLQSLAGEWGSVKGGCTFRRQLQVWCPRA